MLKGAPADDASAAETSRPHREIDLLIPRLIVKRVGESLALLLVISLVVFAGTEMLPGDVAQMVLGQGATPAALDALRHSLHLDQPGWLRYLHWLGGLLTGNPGVSLVDHLPITHLVGGRLDNSLLLALFTTVVTVPIALAVGITSAVWRGTLYDRIVNLATLGTVSLPEFLFATIAVLIFAVHLHWLPALSGVARIDSLGGLLRSFALPVLTLALVIFAQMARMTRAALINTLSAPYIEMAILKGVRPVRLVLRHALPNAIGPIANAIALSLSVLLGGVVIVENIFDYPGIAKLMVDAVSTRDMPLIQACAMIFCLAYLILVLVADIAAILSNPRLRHR